MADYSLFTQVCGNLFTTILIYVDDMIIIGNDPTTISILKGFFNKKFRIKDLGKVKYFLGIEVARSKEDISISQQKYTLDVLDDIGFLGATPITFPME